MSSIPRRAGVCLCTVALIALAVPAFASATPSTASMVAAINSARVHNGLRPLRVAAPIEHASSSYARVLARRGRFQHARQTSSGRFRLVSEILGLAPGSGGMIQGVVKAWLHSPVHRSILLGAQYRYVGVGVAVGHMNGGTDSFWVVRFSR